MSARLDQLQEEQASIRDMLGRLEKKIDASSGGRAALPSVSADQVRAALREMMETEGVELAELAVEGAAKEMPELDIDALFTQLTSGELDWDGSEELWLKVREAGMVDEMVAQFEALAAANPELADAHAALGNAYLQKLFTVDDMQKGVWSAKADVAYDRALEVNPQHWEARFSKAVSYSFWPDFLGKGPEAIEHFEILVEQQEASGMKRPEYAETYLYLGNMLEGKGQIDEAKAIFQRGYDQYPAHAELGKKFN